MATHYYFTPEQEKWLRENYHDIGSYDLLTLLFNSEFGTNRSKESVREKCTKRLGLRGMPNPTVYGKKRKKQLPIGVIRKSRVGTYIKVLDVPPGAKITGYPEPYWLPLQKKIYQDAYGEIPHGKMVCFLDGNPENFDLTNLYCINKKISAVMSSNRWWSKNPELTLAAIKWCELFYTLKEIGKDD